MNLDNITKLLKENSFRVTKSRMAVAEVLIEFKNKYSSSEEIYEIIQKKKGISCDLVSVYRTLAKFEELGIVKKSEFNNEASRFTIADSLTHKARHEHYFRCVKCFVVEAFTDCLVSKKEKELEKNGYRKLTHHLEISGLCPSCA